MVVKEEEERKEGRKGIEEGEGKGMTRKGEEEKERKLRSGRYNFLKLTQSISWVAIFLSRFLS